MRLIDSDALLNKICKKFDIPKDWDGDIAEPLQTIIDIIDNEPAAYDVEKVVQCIHEYFAKKINDCNGNIIPHEILEYNKVICEIVKNGGVE